MSRIGKKPIPLPSGVTAEMSDHRMAVKGPRGELQYAVHPDIQVEVKEGEVVCSIARSSKEAPALWGTTRAQISNLVRGVTEGFKKQLEMHGVGYRAAVKGEGLELHVGFSHPVTIKPPTGISFQVDKETITVEGNDAYLVGEVAASIRAIRVPEPYKGKGIRYAGEVVRRKVGKVVGTTTA